MRMESSTMYLLLYFTSILMRCGDIEVNPGPSQVTEEEFLRLAQQIAPIYYRDLGIQLGIPNAELDHIIAQHTLNYKDALMTVFTRWRDEQRPDEDIRALLAEGLEKSDLGSLSKELLAGNLIQKMPDLALDTATTSTASTSTGAADMSAPSHIVSEEELLKLSMKIGPNYYKRVGINLNISFVTLNKIKEDTQDTTDALMTAFTGWRDKQLPDTNIRALLAEALQKSGLRSLSHQLTTGDLFTNSTSAPTAMPVSQTQPLTPDLVERSRKELQFKYRSFCKIRADCLNPLSLMPFEEMYTNLVLEWKDYRKKKQSLEYKDLFKLEINKDFSKRIIIQGEAGAGKTTLCAKIAWDWINESPDLSKFVWVLLIRLSEAKQYTIGQIVKLYLSKDNPTTACQITNYIRTNPEKVLIACDGLDEFSGKVVQKTETKQGLEGAQPECNDQTDAGPKSKRPKLMESMPLDTPVTSLMPRDGILDASESTTKKSDISLVDILRSDELSMCPVMVTSRPWKANEIIWDANLMMLYTFIHVEGFSRENVEVYIHKYFKDDKVTADQLIQLIKENDIISENMAPYPIYISMLCHMWGELDDTKKEELKSFQTFSEIFCEVFEFLKVRYVQKEISDLSSPLFNTHRSEIEKRMKPIAKIAFTGLQANNLIFNEYDLKEISDSVEIACKVGVLSKENRLSSIHDKSSPFLKPTIVFPHKLFQEYMAAVYLTLLYDSDRSEFKRLIKEVVLPRKEEFRYLLYFTVSRDRNIAKYVMSCLVPHYTQIHSDRTREEEMNFLVDVAFESRDEDAIALLRDSVSSLSIDVEDIHTIAGYASTGIYMKAVKMDVGDYGTVFGPGISNEVAVMVCSAPSLIDVTLSATFHPSFYEALCEKGKTATVHTLQIVNREPLSSASSHHLAGAICSLPHLTTLRLHGDGYQEEFYSNLKENASTLKVHTLVIWNYKPLSSASSHHLAGAICSLPHLTTLRLHGDGYEEEFYSNLKENASTLKVHTLEIGNHEPLSSVSSHHLVGAICSLPHLTELILFGLGNQEEFYSNLKKNASTLKVHTLVIGNVKPISSASSHHLVGAICSLPHLTTLRLYGEGYQEEFYSNLKKNASTLKVHTLVIWNHETLSSASSHHLVGAICSLPHLTTLRLDGWGYQEEFYSNLKKNASTLKVHTLVIENHKPPSSASSHHLGGAICSLPHLTTLRLHGDGYEEEFYSNLKKKASTLKVKSLTLGLPCLSTISHSNLAEALCTMPNLTDLRVESEDIFKSMDAEFCSTLRVNASSIQDSFPQIRSGNFRFNRKHQVDLDSFLQTLDEYESDDESFAESSSSDEDFFAESSSSDEDFFAESSSSDE